MSPLPLCHIAPRAMLASADICCVPAVCKARCKRSLSEQGTTLVLKHPASLWVGTRKPAVCKDWRRVVWLGSRKVHRSILSWLELRVKEQRLLIKTLGGLPKELNFFWGCNSGSLKDLTLGVTFSHLHVRRHPWRECWRWGESRMPGEQSGSSYDPGVCR